MMGSIEEVIAATVRVAVREEVRTAVREAMADIKPLASGDYLTPAQAAKVAGVHVDTIRLWLKSGKLPRHYAGERQRVLREDLDRFLTTPQAAAEDEGPTAEEIAARALERRKGKTQ